MSVRRRATPDQTLGSTTSTCWGNVAPVPAYPTTGNSSRLQTTTPVQVRQSCMYFYSAITSYSEFHSSQCTCGWQVKLCDPSITHAIRECLGGELFTQMSCVHCYVYIYKFTKVPDTADWKLIDWVKVSHPTWHKTGGLVMNKLKLTQQKRTTQEQNSLN